MLKISWAAEELLASQEVHETSKLVANLFTAAHYR